MRSRQTMYQHIAPLLELRIDPLEHAREKSQRDRGAKNFLHRMKRGNIKTEIREVRGVLEKVGGGHLLAVHLEEGCLCKKSVFCVFFPVCGPRRRNVDVVVEERVKELL